MAKSIANGFPMAAVVTTPEIASVLTRAGHFNTFGHNPVSAAAASAVLDVRAFVFKFISSQFHRSLSIMNVILQIIDDEKLMQNAAHTGARLLTSIGQLRQKYEILGDVRGKGLMIGLEFVTDKVRTHKCYSFDGYNTR